ncbi:MAG TPA: hypothetical protein VN517_09920 [Terriglobales bacterium]|nr:hypothetical protein [Terriglobales bacterium]
MDSTSQLWCSITSSQNDIGAAAFRQSYITVQLSQQTTEADLLFELSSLLRNNAAVN